MKRTSLSRRIRLKCLECSGGSPKEVTLCHQFDCPLWAVRFGLPMGSTRYVRRMESAKKNYSEEFKVLSEMGIKYPNFLVEAAIGAMQEKTRRG